MKIYNKKGFAWGIFWLVLGVSALAADLWINPDDFLPKTIKDVIIDFIILIMGLVGFLRAFSAKATREDIIEENDERNKLVKLKSEAKTGNLMLWVYCIVAVIGGVGFTLTANEGWAFFCVTALLLISIWFVIAIVTYIYYDSKL